MLVNNLSRLFQTQESDRAYDVSQSDCLSLLQAMELDDKSENDARLMEEEQGEEEEMVNLPDDWIFNLQQENALAQDAIEMVQVEGGI